MTKPKLALVTDAPALSFEEELKRKISKREYVDDSEFDRLYPVIQRMISSVHWTPVEAAIRIGALATPGPGGRVLDVGSGVGKFCCIGALTTDATFTGVEQRDTLVDIANDVAGRLNLSNTHFYHMNAMEMEWSEYQTIYFYNPFSENLDQSIRIDDLCELSEALYVSYVRQTQRKLMALNPGTRVITYNGIGGVFPPTFRVIHEEEIGFLSLKVWIKE